MLRPATAPPSVGISTAKRVSGETDPVETRSRPIRWGLPDFAWAWVAIIFGQVVVGTVTLQARGFGVGHKSDAIDIAVITAASALLTAAILALISTLKGQGSLVSDFGLRVRLRDWPWLAAGVGLQLVATAGVELINLVGGPQPEQDVARALQNSGTIGRVLGALAVVIGAPLAEELLFRGLLLRSLLRRMPAVAAALVCGALFAAAHLFDPNAAVLIAPLMLVGVVCSIRAIRTGELSQSLLVHAGFNLLSAIILIQG